MNEPKPDDRMAAIERSLSGLERRLGKVELVLGMADEPVQPAAAAATPQRRKGELEMALGQHWFARIGIVVLTIGGMLTMSLSWPNLPPLAPTAVGALAAVTMFVIAHLMHKRMPMNARFFRGSGMALFFISALRLCHFTEHPYLDPASGVAAGLMAVVVAINLAVGWWRKSVILTGLALLSGFAAALAVGATGFTFGVVTVLLAWSGWAAIRRQWLWLPVVAMPLAFLTYLLWALGNPLLGNPVGIVTSPVAALGMLLGWIAGMAVLMLGCPHRSAEAMELNVGSVFNCAGYGLFLLHSLTGFIDRFAVLNGVASLVLLGLAVMMWLRERRQFVTFVYAMTGYGALTVALIRFSEVPELFVWLSAQSLLVVVTALWFRSRFIIVANFLIYLAVISGYMTLVEEETGISLIFVVVALTSARILKLKMDRLELKTELMRNAYLVSAFVVFPYALYHSVPSSWVATSWVGIALFYYGMNLITKAQKYRWMGHYTLLLTVAYIVILGIGRTEGTQRVVSFLLLGTVLLVVSLVFSVIHSRQHRRGRGASDDAPGD